MWDNAVKIRDYVIKKEIYVEDLDIQLHVYVFPMTSDLLTYCQENKYRFDIAAGGITDYPHYDFTYTDIDEVEWVTNCTEETGFSLGTCAAAGFDFSIFSEKYLDDGSVITYEQIEFKGAIVIPVYDFSYEDTLIVQKQLGVFHVRECEKDTDKIDFTCLDNMFFFDKKAKGIQNYLTVPLKSNALVGKIIEKLNLAEGSFPMAVKYFRVNEVKHLKKLTYRTIISYAMEAIGCYAYINSIGEFCCKSFHASATPVATISYEDVMEEKSKGTGVKFNGYEIQYGDIVTSAFSYAAGEIVEEVPVPLTVDNPLFIKKKQESLSTIGKRIFDRMYGFTFAPYEVTTFLPNFYIEAGDFVNVEDKNGEIHKVLVSQLTWRDNLEMEIVSACDTGDADGDYDSDVNEAILRNGNIDSVPSEEDSEEDTVASFSFTGMDFNSAIKTVANNANKTYTYFDETIQRVVFSEQSPDDYESSEIYHKLMLEETTLGYQFTVFTLVSEPSTVRMFCDADIVQLPPDMSYMFYNCSKLTEIDVSSFDTSKVTNMAHMFRNCFSSTEFTLSEFDTSNVTNMSYMFYGSKATSLNVSSFDTSKVTNMAYMFSSCKSLTEIELSSFDTSNVTDMSNMFFNCTALTSLSVSFDTSNVITMNSMFRNCTALTSLSVKFDTVNVKDMTQMFASCEKLTSLSFLFSDTSNVTSMRAMFGDCKKLTSLDLRSFNTSNVTDMYCMFSGCTKLGEILVSSGKWVMNGDTTYMFLSCKVSEVTYV